MVIKTERPFNIHGFDRVTGFDPLPHREAMLVNMLVRSLLADPMVLAGFARLPIHPQFQNPFEGRVIFIVFVPRPVDRQAHNVFTNTFRQKTEDPAPQAHQKTAPASEPRSKPSAPPAVQEPPAVDPKTLEFYRSRSKISNATVGNDYSLLGLTPSATIEEIKKQYRKLLLFLHPDKNNNSEISTEAFKLLQSAFDRIKAARGFN